MANKNHEGATFASENQQSTQQLQYLSPTSYFVRSENFEKSRRKLHHQADPGSVSFVQNSSTTSSASTSLPTMQGQLGVLARRRWRQPCRGPPARRQRQHLSPPGPRNEQYKCAICRPRRAPPSSTPSTTLLHAQVGVWCHLVARGRQLVHCSSSLDSRERDASPCEPLTESWECSRADNAQQLVLYDTIVMLYTALF